LYLITGRMAVSVVEDLEMVDIEHHHRERCSASPVPADLPHQGLIKVLAVEQPGQRIANCLLEPPYRRAVPTTPADRVGARVDCFPTRAAFPK
jgi:hypothetical protein